MHILSYNYLKKWSDILGSVHQISYIYIIDIFGHQSWFNMIMNKDKLLVVGVYIRITLECMFHVGTFFRIAILY